MLVEKLRALPIFVMVFMAFIVIVSVAGVATLSVATTTTAASLTAESFVADSATTVENTGISKASANVSATGQTRGAAIDAGTDVAGTAVNGALTKDNFTYQFEVKESGIATWGSAREYRIEVFGDGSLLATLFIKNSPADVNNVEGVTGKVDIGGGPTLPDAMTITVQKISSD